ncbi:HD domain-containing protein [Auricularia subglabra TFB-10046 SS5]|nr:HD domain-containing protein [Auricularia subglabra TFB-10046 SS5]
MSESISDNPLPPRTFSPLYRSSGNGPQDLLAFFHILERLKTQKRTGWLVKKIPDAESISDHMYRMGILAMCTNDASLDVPKCVMLALVHDIAEAQVGDITPHEGISKAEKRRLEAASSLPGVETPFLIHLQEAMQNFVHEMFHDSPAGQRIHTLWQEYEEQKTLEAQFVKGEQFDLVRRLVFTFADLDRLEVSLQAREYEERHGTPNLQEFYDSSLPSIKHPEVRQWGQDLLGERDRARASSSSSS